VIDSRGWASFEHRIALSCFNFAIFFPRGFSATSDPSIGLTIIVEALILLKKLRKFGLFVPFTGFDPSEK